MVFWRRNRYRLWGDAAKGKRATTMGKAMRTEDGEQTTRAELEW